LWRRKKQETRAAEKAPEHDLVKELCGSDQRLYNAMTYVLLLNPERLLELRGIEAFAKAGEEAAKAGDKTRARISYETAGKLALWKRDASGAKQFFKKSLDVAESDERKTIYETVLDKIDEVVSVAAKYYEMKTGESQ
jgi:hypothetical protein